MICKYCRKEIPKGAVWNPDRYGNGYHYKCLIEMEFDRATDVKAVPLARIKEAREKIESKSFLDWDYDGAQEYLLLASETLSIIDDLIAEVEG